MKNKPEIIKELVKLEKNGKLKSYSKTTYEQIDDINLQYHEDEKIKIFDNSLKIIKSALTSGEKNSLSQNVSE